MTTVTRHFVLAFDRTDESEVEPGEAVEMPSYHAAYLRAQALGPKHAGVIAFSRTGEATTGKFSDAMVIVSVGEVNLNALAR